MKHYISVLSIAGSDSGGGAGIQADLKTFAALGCYGTSAVTAITVQNTVGVFDIHPIPAAIVAGQIKAVLDDIKPSAIKIGMIQSSATALAITGLLKAYPHIPIVLDPVMISSSGRKLLDDATLRILQEQLFPLVTLLTPNLDEAAVLSGLPIDSVEDMQAAAARISCNAVLVKGGHLSGTQLYNVYQDKSGNQHIFPSEAIATRNTHGTGCTLSSAIAAFLARGEALIAAIEKAGSYMHNAIAAGSDVKTGEGHGPVNHFFDPEKALTITQQQVIR